MYLLPMRKTVLSELFEVNVISMMVEKSTLYQETSVERGNQLLKKKWEPFMEIITSKFYVW